MAIEWEVFNGASSIAPRDMYGEQWRTVPCIAVTGGGVTFNAAAIKTFGIDAGSAVRAAFSKDGTMLGFRILSRSEDQAGSMLVRSCAKNGKRSKTSCYVSNRSFFRRLEKYRGHVCELSMERESHMVVAMLDCPVHVWVRPQKKAPNQ